ncbi:MAG: translesion DNA synthesis-associated protein ImuA [Woeseiaceae bacterium]|nr:translesion DNA synthesis-associated protein ImuA [Woeseiaceae bacterium]
MNEALENLLQSPRLWRGQAQGNAWQGLPTGYPRLDEHLPGGGWPRRSLTEILLTHYGSGELKLLMPALAMLSRPRPAQDTADGAEAGWLAWVAPPFQPYPPALLQWGIDLARVLIVRPRAQRDALWAAEQALTSGNCAAVLLWSDAQDLTASRRLQLAAEQGGSWAIAFRPVQARGEPSAAALRLELKTGARGTDIHILKNRGGRPAAVHGVIHDYASLPGN